MGNIVVINAVNLTPFAEETLAGGGNSIDRVLDWARSLPEVEGVFFLVSSGEGYRPSGAEYIEKEWWGEQELLETFRNLGEGHARIFYAYADAPLLDGELSRRIYENHLKYYAQYSFADGYPYGLTPEIINTGILPALIDLVAQENPSVERNTLFTVLGRDINSFDVETEIAPRDQRLLRLSLTADTGRNFLFLRLVERLLAPSTHSPL